MVSTKQSKKTRRNKRNNEIDDTKEEFMYEEMDHYALRKPRCCRKDHMRYPNCEDNPNCLFGLGEYKLGMWKTETFIDKILGFDPSKMLRKMYHEDVIQRTLLSMPTGLQNLGATCYLNSMLQCLFVIRRLRKAVFDWENKHDDTHLKCRLMTTLQKTFANMQLTKANYCDPSPFADCLMLDNETQQDAQEFNKLLISTLKDFFTSCDKEEYKNLIPNMFRGRLEYITICTSCCEVSRKPGEFYEMDYLKDEMLTSENQYFCENCSKKQDALRRIELSESEMPEILNIQLMRFVYDMKTLSRKKLKDKVIINKVLDMTEIFSEIKLAQSPMHQAKHRKIELHKNLNSENNNHNHNHNNNNNIYELIGLCKHQGDSAVVGHYVANVRHSYDDKGNFIWYSFDDDVVRELDSSTQGKKSKVVKTASNLDTNEGERSGDAYMLMYRKRDAIRRELDLIPLPPQSIKDEIENVNHEYDLQCTLFQEKLIALENEINDRKALYQRLFEKKNEEEEEEGEKIFWIDTAWLQSWILGETIGKYEINLSNTNQCVGEKESVSKLGSQETDAIANKTTGLINTQEVCKETCENSRLFLFSEKMDLRRFSCKHSKFSFSPRHIDQLKRIPEEMFNEFLNSLGCEDTIFSSSTFRCEECENQCLEESKILLEAADRDQLLLRLLKKVDENENKEQSKEDLFLISKKWITFAKRHLRGSKNISSSLYFTTKVKKEDPSDQKDGSAECVNANIVCEHGNLTTEKRGYRPVCRMTLDLIKSKYVVQHEFPAGEEPCKLCVESHNQFLKKNQKHKQATMELLTLHPSLKTLYRRKTGVPLKSTSSTSLHPLQVHEKYYVVECQWMKFWRSCISGDNLKTPSQLINKNVSCNHHGNIVPPVNIFRLVSNQCDIKEFQSLTVLCHEDVPCGELVTDVEWTALCESYQAQYELLVVMDDQFCPTWRLTNRHDSTPPTDTLCEECFKVAEELVREKEENFEDQFITVRILREGELPPESGENRNRQGRGRGMASRNRQILASSSDNILLIKCKICEILEHLPTSQSIYYEGKVLLNEMTLKKARVNSILYVVVNRSTKPEDRIFLPMGEEHERGFQGTYFSSDRTIPNEMEFPSDPIDLSCSQETDG